MHDDGNTLLRPGLLLLTLVAMTAAADAPVGRRMGSLQFTPCTLSAPGSPTTVSAFCGRLAVPEDASQPRGRAIELAVAVVPGRAKRARPDPVFMLAGGPGQSALETFPAVAPAFGGLLRDRDVVLVDQRGTGASHPLKCPAAAEGTLAATEHADSPAARRSAEQCLATLDGDPRQYTTTAAVTDLESVRRAIGAPEVNLVGISYGTRVALEYLRRFPQRTRTVILDGVVPPEVALGADTARNLEAALDAHFALCERDATCRRQYGEPRTLLERLLADLRREPRSVRYRDPLTSELHEDQLTPDVVAGVVRLYAYVPQLAAMLPRSLAEAAAGRPEVLMAQGRMIESLVGEQIAQGMQLSVTCTEDADRMRVKDDDASTLLGTGFTAALLAQCEAWPKGTRPADFAAPVRSDRPVLLLSGELDPVTPPRYGAMVVKTLPNGRHLVLRGQGHNVMAVGCVPRLMERFVATADAAALDAACLERLAPPPPFVGAYGWDP
jgi:pimeloyl-ACP methyl ester carboxylesterase